MDLASFRSRRKLDMFRKAGLAKTDSGLQGTSDWCYGRGATSLFNIEFRPIEPKTLYLAQNYT